MNEQQMQAQSDVVDQTILRMMSLALNDLVCACLDDKGKPRTPSKDAVLAARKMLPPYCTQTLVKKKSE